MNGSKNDPTVGSVDIDPETLRVWQNTIGEMALSLLDMEQTQTWLKLRGRTKEAATLAGRMTAFKEEMALIRHYAERLVDLQRQRLESLGRMVRLMDSAIESVFHGDRSALPDPVLDSEDGELPPERDRTRRHIGLGRGRGWARLLLPPRPHRADPSIAPRANVGSNPTVFRPRAVRCVTCRWVDEKIFLLTYKPRGLRHRVHVGRRKGVLVARTRARRRPVPSTHHTKRRRTR